MSDLQVEVFSIEDHEDGGATYTFDMSKGMVDQCVELGLKLLLFCGAAGKSTNFVFDMLTKAIEEENNEL